MFYLNLNSVEGLKNNKSSLNKDRKQKPIAEEKLDAIMEIFQEIRECNPFDEDFEEYSAEQKNGKVRALNSQLERILSAIDHTSTITKNRLKPLLTQHKKKITKIFNHVEKIGELFREEIKVKYEEEKQRGLTNKMLFNGVNEIKENIKKIKEELSL